MMGRRERIGHRRAAQSQGLELSKLTNEGRSQGPTVKVPHSRWYNKYRSGYRFQSAFYPSPTEMKEILSAHLSD